MMSYFHASLFFHVDPARVLRTVSGASCCSGADARSLPARTMCAMKGIASATVLLLGEWCRRVVGASGDRDL